MTNRELQILGQNLRKVGGLKGTKFVYAIAKNNNLIDSELKVIQDVINSIKDIDKYRNELNKKQKETTIKLRAEKDQMKMNEIQEEANKELERLVEKNKPIVDEVEKLWKQDAKIDLHKVKTSDLPEEITAEQLTGIMEIIED